MTTFTKKKSLGIANNANAQIVHGSLWNSCFQWIMFVSAHYKQINCLFTVMFFIRLYPTPQGSACIANTHEYTEINK